MGQTPIKIKEALEAGSGFDEEKRMMRKARFV